MTTTALEKNKTEQGGERGRAASLATRIIQGANALADFVSGLTNEQWNAAISVSDPRTVGVIVHHVANMYPIEIDAAKTIAKGEAITDVTWQAVAGINAAHADDFRQVSKQEAIELLIKNSDAAAEAVRQFTDAELDTAAPFSLTYGAPMTAQFVIEDHALRHAWHHLHRIRKTLEK